MSQMTGAFDIHVVATCRSWRDRYGVVLAVPRCCVGSVVEWRVGLRFETDHDLFGRMIARTIRLEDEVESQCWPGGRTGGGVGNGKSTYWGIVGAAGSKSRSTGTNGPGIGGARSER